MSLVWFDFVVVSFFFSILVQQIQYFSAWASNIDLIAPAHTHTSLVFSRGSNKNRFDSVWSITFWVCLTTIPFWCCLVIIYVISLHRTRQARVNCSCCCLVWWWWWRRRWRRWQREQHRTRQVPVHSIFVQAPNATNTNTPNASDQQRHKQSTTNQQPPNLQQKRKKISKNLLLYISPESHMISIGNGYVLNWWQWYDMSRISNLMLTSFYFYI